MADGLSRRLGPPIVEGRPEPGQTRVVLIGRRCDLTLRKRLARAIGQFPEEASASPQHATVQTVTLREMDTQFLSGDPQGVVLPRPRLPAGALAAA